MFVRHRVLGACYKQAPFSANLTASSEGKNCSGTFVGSSNSFSSFSQLTSTGTSNQPKLLAVFSKVRLSHHMFITSYNPVCWLAFPVQYNHTCYDLCQDISLIF